jgi:hypothetical protein
MNQNWFTRLGAARLSAEYALCRLRGLLEGRPGVRPEFACGIWLQARFRAQQASDAVVHAALNGIAGVNPAVTRGSNNDVAPERTVFPAIQRALEPLRLEHLLATEALRPLAGVSYLDTSWIVESVFPLMMRRFGDVEGPPEEWGLGTTSKDGCSWDDLFDAFRARLELRGAAMSFGALTQAIGTLSEQDLGKLRVMRVYLREADTSATSLVRNDSLARSAARRASTVERLTGRADAARLASDDGAAFRALREELGLVHEPLRDTDLPWRVAGADSEGRVWI